MIVGRIAVQPAPSHPWDRAPILGEIFGEGALDANCYDLLASEARLDCFVATAKGGAVLVSWSGSMFEYLVPSLVMRALEGSLLEDTSELVARLIAFGAEQDVPWGVSESAYNVRDVEYTYQYSNFGVPGLGLKRWRDAKLVIAPYATGLAAMVDPAAAVRNPSRLAAAGALGRLRQGRPVRGRPGQPAGASTRHGRGSAVSCRVSCALHPGSEVRAPPHQLAG